MGGGCLGWMWVSRQNGEWVDSKKGGQDQRWTRWMGGMGPRRGQRVGSQDRWDGVGGWRPAALKDTWVCGEWMVGAGAGAGAGLLGLGTE